MPLQLYCLLVAGWQSGYGYFKRAPSWLVKEDKKNEETKIFDLL